MKIEGLLSSFDLAALKRVGPRQFVTAHTPPEWLFQVLPGVETGVPFHLEDMDPFLEGFLYEAEEYWEAPGEDPLLSGMWIGGSEELPLEATATFQDQEPILVLRGLMSFFPEHTRQLQLSREHLLLNEQLQKSNDRRQVLVHCVIHDLNSPLASLKLALEMLGREQTPEERATVLKLAERQVQKQSDLVTDILEAFKADANAITEGSNETLSLADVLKSLEDVKSELESTLRRKKLTLTISQDPALTDSLVVTGNSRRLVRLVFNLADNAARIAPRKSNLFFRLVPDGAHGVRILVEDEGPGLEPNAEHQIFHKLTQGRGGRGKLGLGLYYCRMTARSWGGDVGCTNREEGGARFWITLTPPEAD